ncbi:conserved hypothetical protein [Aspergillus terreus NIH2624]|uniref:DUF803 domain membrane protein n=1 Tax=Aspergillus terreus (strain NIH 2624 / FGSC A1156) TaxID=341663 RepID=Q0C9K3_ASPTN|nr:uncharacterized protein ATEG_09631 [Aspergillus terreus NIH2624]EAU29822.1 conserved hypothetical protein [Aspergillus terreus NIH2624]
MDIYARSDSASRPASYKAIGIALAVASGLFIGVSFVIKKVGLLKANVKYNEEAGEGYGYLKNAWWWTGMTLMIVGEICNFVAYAFVDAILVTPLGALSVVITTILSAIFLKERLSFVGKVGCFTCILGSVIIAMNAPEQSSVSDIQDMKDYVIAPGFLSYAGVIVVGAIFTALWAGPRYGKKSMFVYISICSSIGGLSVVATQGLGAAILAQINGKSQFNQWFLYVLAVFVIATLLTEIIYLNKALNIFNAALVTPTYYVLFTSATIITSAILFRGFKGTGIQIATVIMGFLQICAGVVLLQLSKSAKDVPDAAVFKGDLDQIREVATQEEPESEPKADSIRGAASLIRRLSTPRRNLEAEEARRYYRERLEDQRHPPSPNEIIEWDGLRRRRTVIGQGPTMHAARAPSVRTPLPPLGMSRFPEENPDDHADDRPGTKHSGHSILSDLRSRLSSAQWQPIQEEDGLRPMPLQPSRIDTSYHGSDPTAPPLPSPSPSQRAKRQFSFNVFKPHHSHHRSADRPRSKRHSNSEEERLGLVRASVEDNLDEKLERTYSSDSAEETGHSLGLPSGLREEARDPPPAYPMPGLPPTSSSRVHRNPLPPLPDEPPYDPRVDGVRERSESDVSAGTLSSARGVGQGGWRRPGGSFT